MELHLVDERHLALRQVPDEVADCLLEVPGILRRRDAAGARRRLHPDAFPADAERNAEWHRLMDSELRHLFEAAADTLAADLRGFDRRRRQVVFPAGHLRAWMSAVNQTRVLLTELHGLEESDMQRTEYDPGSARDAALARVQLLGWLLETLVRHSLETG